MAELVKVYIVIVTMCYANDPKNVVFAIESEEYTEYPPEPLILDACVNAYDKHGNHYRYVAIVEERYVFKED
jgi:hypothetical protein